MDKLPDFDLSTPEYIFLNIGSLVMSSKRDNYQIHSIARLRSDARKISLDVTGEYFNSEEIYTTGQLDKIETEVKLTLDVDKADLDGKVKKVMGGKEYSIEFQPGLAMPIIKMGA